MPFVRLIWKESRFNPQAVSPKGAQGIAQFMPGTAEERGLDDPFEPKSAIVHSASLLGRPSTGSSAISGSRLPPITLAPSGCARGSPDRVGLPWETQNYVPFVTGRAAEEWKLEETELPERSRPRAPRCWNSCRALAPLVVRAVYETEPLTASGAWRPWGVHVSTSFSKAKALAQFGAVASGRIQALLGDREPFVLPERNLSRGRRALYMVQIGADSRRRRREALCKLCAREEAPASCRRTEALPSMLRPPVGRIVSVAISTVPGIRSYAACRLGLAENGRSDAHHL